MRCWRSCRGQRQRAHQDPVREFDLEVIVAGGRGVGERRLRRAAEGSPIGRAACRSFSAARARHGLAATPPSASRASRIVPASIRKAAAAETTAKA